jgi:hypothetical protein
MPGINTQRGQPHKGEVRIRSNVCNSPDAWHLVPGDLLQSHALTVHQKDELLYHAIALGPNRASRELSLTQKNELMYYERCCLCHRTIFEIEEDGCDYCAERGHGTLSVTEARRRRQQRYAPQQEPSS